jgi:hypothetical protein
MTIHTYARQLYDIGYLISQRYRLLWLPLKESQPSVRANELSNLFKATMQILFKNSLS